MDFAREQYLNAEAVVLEKELKLLDIIEAVRNRHQFNEFVQCERYREHDGCLWFHYTVTGYSDTWALFASYNGYRLTLETIESRFRISREYMYRVGAGWVYDPDNDYF